MPIIQPQVGTGYTRSDGRHADVESLVAAPSTEYAAGQTLGEVVEMGDCSTARLTLHSSAKSGTSPTLDCTLQHSSDCAIWRTLGTFAQQTNAADGYTVSSVTPEGTTPPTLTLSGTLSRPLNLRVECTLLGARGTWTGRYSFDNGVTWTAFTSAATVALTGSGLTLAIATGSAAVDNVWTASTSNHESKVFAGCDRYLRPVFTVGGSDTPKVTAVLSGEAV